MYIIEVVEVNNIISTIKGKVHSIVIVGGYVVTRDDVVAGRVEANSIVIVGGYVVTRNGIVSRIEEANSIVIVGGYVVTRDDVVAGREEANSIVIVGGYVVTRDDVVAGREEANSIVIAGDGVVAYVVATGMIYGYALVVWKHATSFYSEVLDAYVVSFYGNHVARSIVTINNS
jgi:hypothetical protein